MKGGKTGESQINLFFADTKAVINMQSFLISAQSFVVFFFFFPFLIPGYPVWIKAFSMQQSIAYAQAASQVKTKLTSQASLSPTLNHSE